MSWMLAIAVFLGAIWFACEKNYEDMNAPEPKDPFRMDRLKNGERLTIDE